MDSIFWNLTKRKQESYVRNLMMKNMAIIRLPVRLFLPPDVKNCAFEISQTEEIESGQPMIMTASQEKFSTNQISLLDDQSEIFFETCHRIICRKLNSMKIKVKRKRKLRIGFDTGRKNCHYRSRWRHFYLISEKA